MSCEDKMKRRLPEWLKRRIPADKKMAGVTDLLRELELTTVCESAHCPNRGECFSCGTATFMILGDRCTRNCRFCAVPTTKKFEPPRVDEPRAVAQAAARMNLKYVVITSVTRDDLPDGGSGHFAETILAVREEVPNAKIEVLTPDFKGDTKALDTVIDARPHVFNHNVETIERFYPSVRPQADFRQSLDVLNYVHAESKRRNLGIYTKSGFMVGLGETYDEVVGLLGDLKKANCRIVTIGQYLAPSDAHVKVERFVHPDEFEKYRAVGMDMGFLAVASGPFVRSSYHAKEVFEDSADKSK